MAGILDGIVLAEVVVDDVSEISSDPSDEEMMIVRTSDEVIDLDDALLALPALENVDAAADANLPRPVALPPVDRAAQVQGVVPSYGIFFFN